MGTFDAGTLNGDPRQLPDHGPRPGHRLRDGQRQEGRDLLAALELRQGRARPALLPPPLERPGQEPEDVLQGRREDPADVQLVLHRQQEHRRVHERPAADARPKTSIRACRPRAPASTSGRASSRNNKHPHGKNPKNGQMSTGTRTSPRASAPPMTSGAAPARVARVDLLNTQHERRSSPQRQVDLAGVTAAMNAGATQDVRAIVTVPLLDRSCSRARTPRTRRPQQMLEADEALARRGRQPPRPRPRRQDRRSRAPPRWTSPGTTIADAFMKPQHRPAARRARLAVLAVRPAAERPVRGLVPVLRPRHPQAARRQGQVSRSTVSYCGKGKLAKCQTVDLERDRRRPAPSSRPSRGRRTRDVARRRDRASGSSSPRSC